MRRSFAFLLPLLAFLSTAAEASPFVFVQQASHLRARVEYPTGMGYFVDEEAVGTHSSPLVTTAPTDYGVSASGPLGSADATHAWTVTATSIGLDAGASASSSDVDTASRSEGRFDVVFEVLTTSAFTFTWYGFAQSEANPFTWLTDASSNLIVEAVEDQIVGATTPPFTTQTGTLDPGTYTLTGGSGSGSAIASPGGSWGFVLAIPEPTTALLVAAGLVAFGARRRARG